MEQHRLRGRDNAMVTVGKLEMNETPLLASMNILRNYEIETKVARRWIRTSCRFSHLRCASKQSTRYADRIKTFWGHGRPQAGGLHAKRTGEVNILPGQLTAVTAACSSAFVSGSVLRSLPVPLPFPPAQRSFRTFNVELLPTAEGRKNLSRQMHASGFDANPI